jgi:curli production assembly/transport component CsgG
MKRVLLSLSIVALLSGCAAIQSTGLSEADPTVTTSMRGVKKEFDTIPAPAAGKPISVAVYSFADKTGQRRPQANVASLSSAVTQGAETFLIQALQGVGRSQWFEVVERVGIDNLTKERLIIRQMREAYEGNNAKPLMPMQFAGMIIEGGIVGYDTTVNSGGAGMRIFGIGRQTQWSQDTVTISVRAVSVNTGKVLAVVTVQKTILSTADSATALRFFDAGTQAFEAEAGLTINEPGTYAVKAAIEMAVVELIKEGQRKSIWDFKSNIPVVVAPPAPPTVVPPPVISSEIRKPEEKKNELVQTQTPKAPTPIQESPAAAPQQSDDRKAPAGVEGKSETIKEEVKPVSKKADADLKVTDMQTGVKPTETKMATDASNASRALFGFKVLKENAFLYAEEKETSTKKWWFAKGTVMSIRQPGTEGWWRVMVADGSDRGGWVQSNKLEEKK